MIFLKRNNNKHITLIVNFNWLDFGPEFESRCKLVSACLELVVCTCKSASNFSIDYHTDDSFQASIELTTLRIAEQTAESLSFVTGISCKWHLNFGRVAQPVVKS